MKGDHNLIAASTRSQEPGDEDDGQELGREFRLRPSSGNLMHVNLAIGNGNSFEFAYEATRDPDDVLRW